MFELFEHLDLWNYTFTYKRRGGAICKRLKSLRQNKTCKYCYRRAGTIDHKHPLKYGGRNNKTNLVPACGRCNSEKGTMSFDMYAFYKYWSTIRVNIKVPKAKKIKRLKFNKEAQKFKRKLIYPYILKSKGTIVKLGKNHVVIKWNNLGTESIEKKIIPNIHYIYQYSFVANVTRDKYFKTTHLEIVWS